MLKLEKYIFLKKRTIIENCLSLRKGFLITEKYNNSLMESLKLMLI